MLLIGVWTRRAPHGSVVRVEGELQQVVGRNIRRIRTERGVSQEELAETLAVHRTYLGGVERGERNLTLCSLERLAGRLGVRPLALLTGEGEDPAVPAPRHRR